jgi:hypothetical protein
MDFVFKNLKRSVVDVARSAGYMIIDSNPNEYNLVRPLAGRGGYPRFHVYLKQRGVDTIFSLHLDQRKPVYENSGSHAHSGEYFGPLVQEEADRIKEILSNSNEDGNELDYD